MKKEPVADGCTKGNPAINNIAIVIATTAEQTRKKPLLNVFGADEFCRLGLF